LYDLKYKVISQDDRRGKLKKYLLIIKRNELSLNSTYYKLLAFLRVGKVKHV